MTEEMTMKLSEIGKIRRLGEYTDQDGITWKFQRTTAAVTAKINSLTTPPRKLGADGKSFEDQPQDIRMAKAMKVGYAVVEPEIDFDETIPTEAPDAFDRILRAKAETVLKTLSDIDIQRLWEMSLIQDDIDLAKKIQEEAKN